MGKRVLSHPALSERGRASQPSSTLCLPQVPEQAVFSLSCYNWHGSMKTLPGLSLLPKTQYMAYVLPWTQLLRREGRFPLLRQARCRATVTPSGRAW